MAMGFIIFAESWVSFLTNPQNYGPQFFIYLGGIMGHISSNMGGIMDPNFESEWHVPFQS